MTFSQALAMLPYLMQQRYSADKFVGWANEWLRRLARERVLPELVKEVGVEVYNDRWITKPAGYITPRELYHPAQREVVFAIEETADKITFSDKTKTFDREETPAYTASAFTTYSTQGMTADIDNLAEDDLSNQLLVVDGGTESGLTIIISNNTASAGGITSLTFLHPISSALSDTKITSCYLVDEDSYLVLKYQSTYDTVTSMGATIPVDDAHQDSLLAYWQWKANSLVAAFGQETKEWENQFEKELSKTKMAVLGGNRSRRAVPRYMAGLRQDPNCRYSRTHTTAE